MGLSVDFIGSIKPSSGPVREVVHMKQLLSCDVVTKPSAGKKAAGPKRPRRY